MTTTSHAEVALPASPGLLTRAADLLFAMVERRRQRLTLHALSDQALADIGISRADAEHEATRPFWR
jgi:uncharacterized protein YjiS (DUF1127 family)